MCTGIALPLSELPVALVQAHQLEQRVYDREGQKEYRFEWWREPAILPVRWDGRLELLPWGSKARRGALPYGGWVSEDHVASGALGRIEEAVIPATFGIQKGTWFLIVEGIGGVVLFTRAGPVVYMLTKPSTNYYRNMTEQSPVMPVLVNQVI